MPHPLTTTLLASAAVLAALGSVPAVAVLLAFALVLEVVRFALSGTE